MSSLYRMLNTARPPQRREVARRLVTHMQGNDGAANRAYLDVCRTVIAHEGAQEAPSDEALPRWEFPADNSALLLNAIPRVAGFIGAVARAPQARSIIDAGCGSSAVLAVAAAVEHPRAEVVALEINEPAARCAAAMVELMGFRHQITVVTADVLTAELPVADLAVTETFASGLTVELGTCITEALGRTSSEVLPASVKLFACDELDPPKAPWQLAGEVDLTARNETITGMLAGTGVGNRPVRVWAGYYDARGEAVLAEYGVNNLTEAVNLGNVTVPHVGAEIGFSYAAGAELHETPAQLWVASGY